MFVDNAWCLACNCQLDDSERAYCSHECEASDRAPLTHSHPRPALRLPEPELEDDLDLELDLEVETELVDDAPFQSYHRARFANIDRWRVQVPPGASPDLHPLRVPSTSSLASSPTSMLLSASVLAPPCLALPLPPTHRLLPPATDIESLCPPTLALTVDDSPVVTPPTQSVAAPGVVVPPQQAYQHGAAPFKWMSDRLRSWAASRNGAEKEKDPLPVGAEAATFYATLTRSKPMPVPSPQRAAHGGHYHFAGCAHCDRAADSHCH
ncbi:hypothetical protein AURDEDRAFT_113255 [Auricularia subglabra TFB-10046 SS5]|nr:hypothetical protein AURDEDRAFT_113255 [Auricularia subglabra TFB-10046 SS5]